MVVQNSLNKDLGSVLTAQHHVCLEAISIETSPEAKFSGGATMASKVSSADSISKKLLMDDCRSLVSPPVTDVEFCTRTQETDLRRRAESVSSSGLVKRKFGFMWQLVGH